MSQNQELTAPSRAESGVNNGQAERRRFRRLDCQILAKINTIGSVAHRTGVVSGVSLNGCFIELPETFPVGTEVELSLAVGSGTHGRGRVRTSLHAKGMGIEFTLMTVPNFRRLQSFARNSVPLHEHGENPEPHTANRPYERPRHAAATGGNTVKIEAKPSFVDYYRLTEQPFGVTPDSAYLYPSQTHREALASLRSGILDLRGSVALIAEPGMGKTTLLYEILDELRDSARTGFLFQTQCNSREFLGYVLSQLGVDAGGMGPVVMHNKLDLLLRNGTTRGKRFVMIVDEAQNLDESVLETIRLLSNFETPRARLLQIILAGQPPLAQKLAQSPLVQLRERISVLTRLQALSPKETVGYIEHRLRVAGHRGELLFAPDALAFIVDWSQGVPRRINTICCDALSLGHARECRKIDLRIMLDAATESDIKSTRPGIKSIELNQLGALRARIYDRPSLGTKRLQKTNWPARAGLRGIS